MPGIVMDHADGETVMGSEAAIGSAIDWVEQQRKTLSDWHATVWDFHEPAWR